jgi:hypothetical protein
MTSTHRKGVSEWYKGNRYLSAFISIYIISFHRSPYMLRQIIVVIIIPLGHAQTYNQDVSSVFIMTGLNTLYSNNSSSSNNNNNKNKHFATHECDKVFYQIK